VPALIHVDLFVSNLETSVAFYRDVFGAQVIDTSETEGHIPIYYSAGRSTRSSMAILRFSMIGATLELMQLENSAVSPSPLQGSISFQVNSLDDFRQRLIEKGIQIDSDTYSVVSDGGIKSRLFFMLDPDGHRLEVVESAKASR
jgi:catechol 2,3-dioxygenase-like lactoylglutathione lyase family enzyme